MQRVGSYCHAVEGAAMNLKPLRIIFFSVVVSLLAFILFGRWLSAEISTLPLLNRWKLLSPQAPIVINTTQQVRVTDSGDILAAIQNSTSKMSAIVSVSGGQMTPLGGAINLTGEGVFVTAANVLPAVLQNDYVITGSGSSLKITAQTVDPATGLVFFSAGASGIPTAALGDSSALVAGEKIIFLTNSTQSSQNRSASGFVTRQENDIVGELFDADHPGRSFKAEAGSALVPGEAVVNTNSEVVGLWDGSKIISSDVLKNALDLYFQNSNAITRPSFGFTYGIVTKVESQLENVPEGALVKTVTKASPAQIAGLLAGDVITNVNGNSINETSPLEQALQNIKPGDTVKVTVTRSHETLQLALTAGTL